MSYKVSILVPVYGVERYIERCVRSLFEQDYDNLEYIFVDDCTPDHSIALLEKTLCDYPNRKDQVRIIKYEKNRGLAAARNTAVQQAKGLFLIHCDSDDWMDTRAVSLLVEQQLSTNADIVIGKAYVVNNDGMADDGMAEWMNLQHDNKEELLLSMVKRTSSVAIWRRLIRTALYQDYHIEAREGVNYGEGFQVTPRLVYYSNSIAWLTRYVYYYNRTNIQSYSQRIRNDKVLKEQRMASFDIVREFFADKEKIYYDAVSESAVRDYWLYAHDAAKQRDRSFFEKCKTAINGKYAGYQYVLGYQNPLKKWFQQQYYLYGTFLRTRSFVWKWMKKVLGKE